MEKTDKVLTVIGLLIWIIGEGFAFRFIRDPKIGILVTVLLLLVTMFCFGFRRITRLFCKQSESNSNEKRAIPAPMKKRMIIIALIGIAIALAAVLPFYLTH